MMFALQDGLFMIAFPEARGAVEWTVLLQLALLKYAIHLPDFVFVFVHACRYSAYCRRAQAAQQTANHRYVVCIISPIRMLVSHSHLQNVRLLNGPL